MSSEFFCALDCLTEATCILIFFYSQSVFNSEADVPCAQDPLSDTCPTDSFSESAPESSSADTHLSSVAESQSQSLLQTQSQSQDITPPLSRLSSSHSFDSNVPHTLTERELERVEIFEDRYSSARPGNSLEILYDTLAKDVIADEDIHVGNDSDTEIEKNESVACIEDVESDEEEIDSQLHWEEIPAACLNEITASDSYQGATQATVDDIIAEDRRNGLPQNIGTKRHVLEAVRNSETPRFNACYAAGLFDKKLRRRVLGCTNIYVRNHGPGWATLQRALKGRKLNVTDYYKFMFALLYMGQVRLPRLYDYWNEGGVYYQERLARTINYSAFRGFLSCLHVEDVIYADIAENAAKTASNPTWRIDWLFKYFNERWRDIAIPSRFLSGDEAMIPSKVRHTLKQYIKGKPHKFGFKLYMLADPASQLCLHSVIHDGKCGSMENIVAKMVPESFHRRGTVIILDNFYTTLQVVRYLQSCGLHVIGTVRPNRIMSKKDGSWVLPSSTKRGTFKVIAQMTARGSSTGIRAVSWVDRRVVNMVTTLPVHRIAIHRRGTVKVCF